MFKGRVTRGGLSEEENGGQHSGIRIDPDTEQGFYAR